MIIVVAYDISQDNNGIKRLSKVHKLCQKHGQKVQNSLYECKIDWRTFLLFKDSLEKCIDKSVDSVTIYRLNDNQNIERLGIEKSFDINHPIII